MELIEVTETEVVLTLKTPLQIGLPNLKDVECLTSRPIILTLHLFHLIFITYKVIHKKLPRLTKFSNKLSIIQ